MDVILPILTLILGYVGSLATEWFRDIRSIKREKKEARTAFQQQTLIELQEALHKHYQSSRALLLNRQYQTLQTGDWMNFQPQLDLARDDTESTARAVVLESRVLDDRVRELVRKHREINARMHRSISRDEAAALFTESDETYQEAMARIGQLIRGF